jgi:YesN/AraC family two-component response regulator
MRHAHQTEHITFRLSRELREKMDQVADFAKREPSACDYDWQEVDRGAQTAILRSALEREIERLYSLIPEVIARRCEESDRRQRATQEAERERQARSERSKQAWAKRRAKAVA